MPKPVFRFWQKSFAGGWRPSAAPDAYAPNEYSDAKNIHLGLDGSVGKRDGILRVHASSTSATVRGGTTWTNASGTRQNVTVASNILYTVAAPPSAALTSAASGLTGSSFLSFAPFVNASGTTVLYIADGTQKISQWNGTSLTVAVASTTTAAPSAIAVYNQRLFAVGDATNPYTLSWSGLNDGGSLGDASNGGGSAIIRTYGQDRLKGLTTVGNSLFLFHERGISVFTGWSQDDFDIDTGTRGLAPNVGLSSFRSVVVVDNVGYFVGNNGFYRFTEAGIQNIGLQLARANPLGGMTATSAPYGFAVAVPHRYEIWFAVPSTDDTTNNTEITVYVYNYARECWVGTMESGSILSGESNFGTAAWLDDTATVDAAFPGVWGPHLYWGATDGFVRLVDYPNVKSDDATIAASSTGGTPFSAYVQSRYFFTPDYDYLAVRRTHANLGTEASMLVAIQPRLATPEDTDYSLPGTAISNLTGTGPTVYQAGGDASNQQVGPTWTVKVMDSASIVTATEPWTCFTVGIEGFVYPGRAKAFS